MGRSTAAIACLIGFVSLGWVRAGDKPMILGATPAAPSTGPTHGHVSPGTATPWPHPMRVPAAVGGGFHYWGSPFFVTVGPNGPVVIGPPPPNLIVVTSNPWPGQGMLGGPMPPQAPQAQSLARPRLRRVDASRRDELVTIGDRLFRAGNFKRAGERYQQALRVDPDAAAPRVRLAQVALKREDYVEAARRIRESVDAEPDWLPRANGVQAIYGEPGDFDLVISRLESHVLNQPGDRDAWLILGAQYYLAGKTRLAADVFVRLSDRKPDATLAAFLDATRAVK